MALDGKPIFNIYCKNDPNFFVTVKNGYVILAPADLYDESQQWYKVDNASGTGFALINKATGDAMDSSAKPFRYTNIDAYIQVWNNEAEIDSDGYTSVRNVNNYDFWFAEGGKAKDGVAVALSGDWNDESYHWWKFQPSVPPFDDKPSFNIYCKDNPNFFVTVRNGYVLLAPADLYDKSQHWYKVENGNGTSFALINKATNDAIDKSAKPFRFKNIDGSIQVWTDAHDGDGTGYSSIRNINNSDFWLAEGGHAKHGVAVALSSTTWNGGNHQLWKLQPSAPTFNIYCKDNPNFFATVKNGYVLLAPADLGDKSQQWFKVENAKATSFALINKVTGHAIDNKAKPFRYRNIDGTIQVWSNARDNDGTGYTSIRNVNNSDFWLAEGGHAKDGVAVALSSTTWNGGNYQLWKLQPSASTFNIYCKDNPNVFVTVKNGYVLLAPADLNDKSQQWYKVDNANGTSFALINKVTGDAIDNKGKPFRYKNLDSSIQIWSDARDKDGSGYTSIRNVNNSDFWLAEGGHAKSDVAVALSSTWNGGNHQLWKLQPVQGGTSS